MNDNISIVVSHCPMCGAAVNIKDRTCGYCRSALIIVSTENLFNRDIDVNILNNSLSKWKEKLKADPQDPAANYALGMTYMNKKLNDSALTHLKIAVRNAPEFSLAHYNLSLLLFNGGFAVSGQDYKDCFKEMEYAEKTDPDFIEAQAFKHYYLAKKLQSVDLKEAIREYKVAIGKCSDIAAFHNNIGYCYFETRKRKDAEQSYKRAIELDPSYTLAYSNLSSLYCKTRKYRDGLDCGKMALDTITNTYPDSYKASAHNNYAMCLWKLKQIGEARSNFKKAIAYDPATTRYTNNLNNLNTELRRVLIVFILGLLSVIPLFGLLFAIPAVNFGVRYLRTSARYRILAFGSFVLVATGIVVTVLAFMSVHPKSNNPGHPKKSSGHHVEYYVPGHTYKGVCQG